jgi:hypothetical protein
VPVAHTLSPVPVFAIIVVLAARMATAAAAQAARTPRAAEQRAIKR